MKSIKIGRFPQPGYAVAEAVNTLCTNLSFSGEKVRIIMVTSCHEAEGKSYLTMNIMRTMAKLGKTVVLVDADLRRSALAARYAFQFPDAQQQYGLAHLLAGKAGEDDVTYSTDIEGAYIVPIGRAVTNPLPLLNSENFKVFLDHLAQQVDYVLIDAPPVGLVIDGAQIAKYCDGALIAVSYNTVRRQQLIDVKDQLEQSGCPILGAVLNMVEYDSYLNKKYYYNKYGAYYNKYGAYYAGQDEDASGKKSKKKRGDHAGNI